MGFLRGGGHSPNPPEGSPIFRFPSYPLRLNPTKLSQIHKTQKPAL